MVRYGVVGCGVIHAEHCRAIQKISGACLEAVYDVVPEKASAAAESFGVYPARDLADLFDRVDAVTICTPSGLHSEIGVQAARAGKHVLSEKPIDVNLPAALAYVEACEQAGVQCGVVSQHRFAADMIKLQQAAQSGELGELVQGDGATKWFRTQAYYDSGAWRGTWKLDGGGCLMNQGVHYVDMLQWVMGGVKSVQAQVRTVARKVEVETVAVAILEYKNGAIGTLCGSTVAYPGYAERLEVYGTHGSVILEADKIRYWNIDPNLPRDTSKYGGGVNRQPTPNVTLPDPQAEGPAGGASDPTAIWGEQHRMQIEDFTRAIETGGKPWVTGRDALEPLKVILAVYESSRRGGATVFLEELK